MKRRTQEEMIEDAKEIHGDWYDYSEIEYKNNKEKIKIICPIHGEFWQSPNHHLRGSGCPKCGKNYRRSQKEFIDEAKEVHEDKYDYSLVEYKNMETKVKIICPIHGEFEKTPKNHLKGQGCPRCSKKYKRKEEDFIREAKEIHGDKYDYSEVKYVNMGTKVKIICPEHGEFWQSPYSHIIQNCGCKYCGGTYKMTKSDFVERARNTHRDTYDYSLVEDEIRTKKVEIICPIHGKFKQSYYSHIAGRGCPICNESHGEREIRIYLKENNIKYEYQKRFKDFIKYPFDFYLPKYNLLIEYDGKQHFETVWEDVEVIKERDKMKDEYAKENGMNLIRITFYEDAIDRLEEICHIQDG